MKRLIFIAALALSTVLAFYSPSGIYLALTLVTAAVIAAAENLISQERPSVRISTPVIEEGTVPRVYFETNKMCRGILVCENSFTHECKEIPICAKHGGELALTEVQNCGELHFSFKSLRRYDLCSLTSRRVKCDIVGRCMVMPKPVLPDDELLEKGISAETELDGAKEYSQGDDLRRINHKLTHRFSQIYINSYSPDEGGEVCLFFDTACEGECTELAKHLRSFMGVSRTLSSQGTDHSAVFWDRDGFRIMHGARTGLDDILTAILSAPTCKGGSTLDEFRSDPRSAEFEKIMIF